MERKIGEKFNVDDKTLVVRIRDTYYGCLGCVFFTRFRCTVAEYSDIVGECSKYEREDKTDVKFIHINKPTPDVTTNIGSTEPKAEPTESVKNDIIDNKVRMDLLPWEELEEVAKVYTAGAKKYGENKWQDLPNGYQRYKGAALRHLTELEKGNYVDEETGCLHAAQFVWNGIAMLHFIMKEMKEKK